MKFSGERAYLRIIGMVVSIGCLVWLVAGGSCNR